MFGANIGPLEIIVVLVIVLLIFGPKRLPSLGRQLGHGMREFKDSITGDSRHDDENDEQAGITAQPDDPPRTPSDAAERSRV